MKKTIVMRLVQKYVESGTAFAVMLNNGIQEQPLRFLEEDSECLIVENITSGAPAAFNYSDINSVMSVSSGAAFASAKAVLVSEGSAEKSSA